jgi:hypothetical protein
MPFLAEGAVAGTLTVYANIAARHQQRHQKLEQRGFSRAQAEGITDAPKELDASSLVTKTDLERAFARTTTTIIARMTGALRAQGALVVALIQYFK